MYNAPLHKRCRGTACIEGKSSCLNFVWLDFERKRGLNVHFWLSRVCNASFFWCACTGGIWLNLTCNLWRCILRYIPWMERVILVDIARIFANGRSQAVRLPKDYRFEGSEVYIKRLDDVVLLIPKDSIWKTLELGVNHFSDDFMTERSQPEIENRKGL